MDRTACSPGTVPPPMELAEKGKAILFISGELPELFGIADRILVMRRGRLVANLPTSRTTQEEVMHLAAVEEN